MKINKMKIYTSRERSGIVISQITYKPFQQVESVTVSPSNRESCKCRCTNIESLFTFITRTVYLFYEQRMMYINTMQADEMHICQAKISFKHKIWVSIFA